MLSGTKRYITNAPTADVFMVFARTDPDAPAGRGISTFLVPRGAPGLTVGPKDHKMGQFGTHTADVYLDGVVVAGRALLRRDPAAGRTGMPRARAGTHSGHVRRDGRAAGGRICAVGQGAAPVGPPDRLVPADPGPDRRTP